MKKLLYFVTFLIFFQITVCTDVSQKQYNTFFKKHSHYRSKIEEGSRLTIPVEAHHKHISSNKENKLKGGEQKNSTLATSYIATSESRLGLTEKSEDEYKSILIRYAKNERSCKKSFQFFVLIDAGSSGNRASFLSFKSVACYSDGRVIVPQSIKFHWKTKVFQGFRDSIEEWLEQNEVKGASEKEKEKYLEQNYESMISFAKMKMTEIFSEVLRLMLRNLPSKLLKNKIAVAVIFHSTAGVRSVHKWYRDGYFMAIRYVINHLNLHPNITFFTNRKWTRHITGREEGVYAFITANHMLNYLDYILKHPKVPIYKNLVGVVEVGGASMQVVFPVNQLEITSPFIQKTNLSTKYLSDNYPNIQTLATSFMQLGINSALGILLKSYCQLSENLKSGVCQMPCFNQGYEQECTANSIKDIKDNQIIFEINQNRLNDVANFCDGNAIEIKFKKNNRRDCISIGINPDEDLKDRLTIKGCSKIIGTGNFVQCMAAVRKHLLDTEFPLPANIEAQYIGFDSPLQIFEFLHPHTDVFISGKALAKPIKDLTEWNLLKKDFRGNIQDLNDAGEKLCNLPIAPLDDLKIGFKFQNGQIQVLNKYNFDYCMKVAYASLILKAILKQDDNQIENKLNISVYFEDTIIDPSTKQNIGEFGWAIGAVLSYAISSDFNKLAYTLGPAYYKSVAVL